MRSAALVVAFAFNLGCSTCPDGSSCLQQPVCCLPGTRVAINVDCAFCCTLPGGSCPLTADQGITAGHPCCTGICDSTGHCACSLVGNSCEVDSDCCSGRCDAGAGEFGQCLPEACVVDAGCPAGQECVDGACMVSNGGSCQSAGECVTGFCVDGGCCSIGCSPEMPACSSQADCPAGSSCATYLQGSSYEDALSTGVFTVEDAGLACCEPANAYGNSELLCCAGFHGTDGLCHNVGPGSPCNNTGGCPTGLSCQQAAFNSSSGLSCCVDNGEACPATGGHCCSGFPLQCGMGEVCGCVPAGQPCTALVNDGGCCSGACSDAGNCR